MRNVFFMTFEASLARQDAAMMAARSQDLVSCCIQDFAKQLRLSTHFVHGSEDMDSPLRIYIEFT